MGWTEPECVACGGDIKNDYICVRTNKIGYKCFECGASGHLELDDILVSTLAWTAVTECPACGTKDVYGGSIGNFEGIASGSIRYPR